VERVIWNDAKTIQILTNQGFDGSDIHDIICMEIRMMAPIEGIF